MSANGVASVETLYLRQPTPEYAQAFDLAASALSGVEGRVLAVLSSEVHGVELLKRCSRPLDLAGTGACDATGFVAAAQAWAWGPLRSVPLTQAEPSTAIIWAEPETPTAMTIANTLRELAAPGATLYVIASGPLRRYLPAWQTQPRPALRPLSPVPVLRALKAAGWRVQNRLGLHGPRAILWSGLFRAAEACGRPDWGDRCLFAMRAQYRESGWLWPLAPLALIHAR